MFLTVNCIKHLAILLFVKIRIFQIKMILKIIFVIDDRSFYSRLTESNEYYWEGCLTGVSI